MSKFQEGEKVKHTKGSSYVILHTPNRCMLEATNEPAYAYQGLGEIVIWVRSQTEMEDGRFTAVE